VKAEKALCSPRVACWFSGRRLSAANLRRLLVLLILAAALFIAWREFWFLTDDAFITFRYIDHHRMGWGYTWNPPPFAPVEGYSNFLWMVLLHGIWAITGAPPPASANVVSLVLSYGTLALTFAMVWRMPLPDRWAPRRFWLVVLVLIYVISNRTFITWTSSGLETALFGFCATLWVFGVLEIGRGRDWRWLLMASVGAATSALTRPDGLLLVLSTLLLGLYFAWQSGGFARLASVGRTLAAMSPMLTVLVHLLWRHAYYGSWVPNTFYAKRVSKWPDAGIRYTASFILEYALWAWILLAVVVALVHLARMKREGLPHRLLTRLPAALIAATFIAHVAYYTLVIGGDHFEYRVFAHLIVPIAVSIARLVASMPVAPTFGIMAHVVCIVLALPVPWAHYARTRGLNTRPATFKMFVPIADAFPSGPMREYALTFDQLQKWMMPRHVGTRHQEHKLFFLQQVLDFPSRNEGRKILWDERALLSMNTVGIPGWVLPEVAVIDYHGLNDKVVAHTPVTNRPAVRLMAHERTPPPGYIECFEPNFPLQGLPGILPRAARKAPLTDERIRDCETRFAQK
jgi:arabinofuranosyltransferase